jgi:hypothetical protein
MRNYESPIDAERIDALVRRAGEERAYYLGEVIGNMLLIAQEGLEAGVRWIYSATRNHSNARALSRRRTHFAPQKAHVTVR